jgi:Na+/melibiose symporter-like transporter
MEENIAARAEAPSPQNSSLLSIRRLLVISSVSFALTMASNTLDPAVFGHKILRLAADRPNTVLGFATLGGSLVAIFVLPLIGALSDRTHTRWGQRIPYLVAGGLTTITALFLIAGANTLALFIAGVLLYYLGNNIIFGPWMALFPDLVPDGQRGRAAGVRAFLDILGLVIGRQAAGQLVGRAGELGEQAVYFAVAVPVAAVIFSIVSTSLASGSSNQSASKGTNEPILETLKNSLAIDFKTYPAFTWWFINRFFFWSAFTILGTFLLFFTIFAIGLPESDAQRILGTLATIIGGSILFVAIPAGRLGDHIGQKPLVVASGVVAGIGTILILFVRDIAMLSVSAGIIGLASGVFISANFALITDIVPKDQAARYLGVSGIASAAGGALARLLGGVMVDPINAALSSASAGYLVLYSLAAVFFLLSALAILPLRHNQIRKSDKL